MRKTNLLTLAVTAIFGTLLVCAVVIVAGYKPSSDMFSLKTKTVEAAPSQSYGYQTSYMYVNGTSFTNGTWNTNVYYYTNQTKTGSIVRTTVKNSGLRTERVIVASNLYGGGTFTNELYPNTTYDYVMYSGLNGRGNTLTSLRFTTQPKPIVPSYGYATITGKVVENKNGTLVPVKYANVSAKNVGTGADANGIYDFNYSLYVSTQGEVVNVTARRANGVGQSATTSVFLRAGDSTVAPTIILPTASYGYQNSRIFKYEDGTPTSVTAGTNSVSLIKFVIHAPTETKATFDYFTFNFDSNLSSGAVKNVYIKDVSTNQVISQVSPELTGNNISIATNPTLVVGSGSYRILSLNADLASDVPYPTNAYLGSKLVNAYSLSSTQVSVEGLPVSRTIQISVPVNTTPTITIRPYNGNSFTVNTGSLIILNAFYDPDGNGPQGEYDVTQVATWGTHNSSVINQLLSPNTKPVPGTYVGISAGTTGATAFYKGVGATAGVTVNPLPRVIPLQASNIITRVRP